MAPHRSGRDEEDSRRILGRVAREADSSAMPSPGDADDDWAEYWGRRIGAVLGPALLALLFLWFLYRLSGEG